MERWKIILLWRITHSLTIALLRPYRKKFDFKKMFEHKNPPVMNYRGLLVRWAIFIQYGESTLSEIAILIGIKVNLFQLKLTSTTMFIWKKKLRKHSKEENYDKSSLRGLRMRKKNTKFSIELSYPKTVIYLLKKHISAKYIKYNPNSRQR